MSVFLNNFVTCLVSFPQYVHLAHLFCRLSFSRFVLSPLSLFEMDVLNLLLQPICFTVFLFLRIIEVVGIYSVCEVSDGCYFLFCWVTKVIRNDDV